MTNNFGKKSFTRLRISAHNLRIETGWHTIPKTPLDDRKCRHCGTLENEIHFLLQCSKSSQSVSARQEFLNELNKLHPEVTPMSNDEKFVFIMSCVNQDSCLLLQNFITKLVRNRGSL